MEKEKKAANPHHSGHRQRLRTRFLENGPSALAEYELLELILFAAHPRGDVKPLAKSLIKEFGSFAKVIEAEPLALKRIEGMGEAGITALKTIAAGAQLLLRQQVEKRPVISSWQALLDYCTLSMAGEKIEQFRVLFLDSKNQLLADVIMQEGTVDHTPVYPREILKKALELGASSLILAHNHPSGDPSPSKADIEMTQQIIAAANAVGLRVHDHLIIGRKGHYSFKSNGLL